MSKILPSVVKNKQRKSISQNTQQQQKTTPQLNEQIKAPVPQK